MVATPTAVSPKSTVRRAELVREPAVRPKAKAASGEDRYRMIAEAAYFLAERRGFAPGREVSDWLAAEIEVDDILGESDPR